MYPAIHLIYLISIYLYIHLYRSIYHLSIHLFVSIYLSIYPSYLSAICIHISYIKKIHSWNDCLFLQHARVPGKISTQSAECLKHSNQNYRGCCTPEAIWGILRAPRRTQLPLQSGWTWREQSPSGQEKCARFKPLWAEKTIQEFF